MLDKFQQKFVEEAQDNVAAIEAALFELENNPTDKEIVERLFRSMHTIKGSGAMFGFNDLSHFTHNLETLYDLVRNGEVAVDSDIISLTFESLDYIRQLLDLGEGTLTNAEDIARQEAYINKIKRYFPAGTGLTLSSAEKAALEAKKAAEEAAAKGPANYLVTFEPNEDLLNNGTNPLFMLDDLTALGKYRTIAFTGKVPALADFKPLGLNVCWQVILETEQDINEIKDVFIFVEDECRMDIAELPRVDIVGDTATLPGLIEKALETQTELKAEDFAPFKNKQAGASSQEQASANKEPGTANQQQGAGNKEPGTGSPEPGAAPAAASKSAAKDSAGLKTPEGNKVTTLKVDAAKIDSLVNAVSELVTMQAQLSLIAQRLDDNNLTNVTEQMEKIVRLLRENSFSISLIPLQTEIIQFQRLVRDLNNKLGKQMDFEVEGGEIELDKTIIDHLKDPLLHIIRNSGDHGIEHPDERVAKGKPARGTILLKAFYSGSSVVVQVSDDGKGMDPEKILKKAVEKGLTKSGANLSKKDILNFIFHSGFSTAEKVSDVSGRGVGMDVVKSKIAEIRGEVTVDSEVDKGTTISMELPLTLSIIDGLLTDIAGEQYVFPFSNVERVLQPRDVEMTSGKTGTFIKYDGKQLLCIDLPEALCQSTYDKDKYRLLVVSQGERRVAMIVNNVMGEHQIVVKPLGSFLRKIDVISGASVMGDGTLSLIIDPGRMINYYNNLRRQRAEAQG